MFVEEYKGVRIRVRVQTHTETGSEFLAGSGLAKKNSDWTPSKPLLHPVYHCSSFEVCADSKSIYKDTAIRKYKEEIDNLLDCAKWKESHGYTPDLFKVSELYLLGVDKTGNA